MIVYDSKPKEREEGAINSLFSHYTLSQAVCFYSNLTFLQFATKTV